MRLHLCCGTVYLKDYINVDIQGNIRNGEIIQETTLKNYYTKPLNQEPRKKRGDFAIDLKVDLLKKWPWSNNSVDEIVMIQAIEHFYPSEALHIIEQIWRVLKPGGIFVFDFPDIVETIKKYADSDFEFMNRLVYCNHKDQYSIHRVAYNQWSFYKLLTRNNTWKDIVWRSVVKHDYPVIGGVVTK